jgi:hypothetical protein
MISHTAHVLLCFVIYQVQKRNIFALAVRDKKKVRKLLERWRFQQGGWKWQLAEKNRTSNCAEQALTLFFFLESVIFLVQPGIVN